jgi:hypothetical protein
MGNRIFILIIITSILLSCKSDYQKYVERESSKDKRYNDLIFGLKIGQTQKEFFNICWELNKRGIITNGDGANVLYTEKIDSLNPKQKRKVLNYYGIFDDEKIMQGVTMTYSYAAWSPSDKSYSADSLMYDVLDKLKYDFPGNDFMKIDMEGTKAYVKIDGNRHIQVYIKDARNVCVKIEDLKFKYKKI